MINMLSFFKNVVSNILNSANDEEDFETETETDLLSKIQRHDDCTISSLSKQIKPQVEQHTVDDDLTVEIKRFMQSDENEINNRDITDNSSKNDRKGTITSLTTEFGIIDDTYYFTSDQVLPSLTLKVGDDVAFSTKKFRENETERVLKIYGCVGDLWENEKIDEDKTEACFEKKIHCQVKSREGRIVYMEQYGISCNLDEVSSSFIPLPGDWVELRTNVEVDEEVNDFAGQILTVKELSHVRYKADVGIVTLWSTFINNDTGIIDQTVCFTLDTCESGYQPCVGDEVIYEAIESEQGNCFWRAISVLPHNTIQQKKRNEPTVEKDDLLSDKNGVTISGPTSVSLTIDKSQEIILIVKNECDVDKILFRTRFNHRVSAQVHLKTPHLMESFMIKPNQCLTYKFQVRAMHIGDSSELFIFYFDGFKIGHRFNIQVLPDNQHKHIVNCEKQVSVVSSRKYDQTLKMNTDHNKNRLYGQKPVIRSRFSRGDKMEIYRIPAKLLNVFTDEHVDVNRTQKELCAILETLAPCLAADLSPANYTDRFHTLLHLEEIASKINIRRYDMKGTIFKHHGEYLRLEVPGLAECRPSLIIGDSVVVSQPWSEINKAEQVGYIHLLQQKHVLVKFHQTFHDSYDESDCDVYFQQSGSYIQKQHNAVRRILQNVGADWLFPTSVKEKQPQVCLVEDVDNIEDEDDDDESDIEEFDVDERGFLMPKIDRRQKILNKISEKKRIKWFNNKLNSLQKKAVMNVLIGKARPLPYVIFGPPGTGKTVTLVECVLQILNTIPSSRVLVASPSNSSADLLCERLLDTGRLLPGDLIRIVSFNRSLDGSIPQKLAPYCSTLENREGSSLPVHSTSVLKLSVTSCVVGRHRVTIGTCGSLASLHGTKLAKGHFTHIVVDESGQCTEPEIMIPLSFLDKDTGEVILAGDPQQLGPVMTSKLAKSYGLEESYLQRIIRRFPYVRDKIGFPDTSGFDPRLVTRLVVNYRSVPEILYITSKMFYDSELVNTVKVNSDREGEIIESMTEYLPIRSDNTTPCIVFHGVRGQNLQQDDCPSWYNPQEVWQVVRYLQKCYLAGVSCEEVGVIAPYNKQVHKIRLLLSELDMPIPKIGSVEEFQGQERQVIILSTVRSSHQHVLSDIYSTLGFIASPRRVNVSLSRARALLVIIGDPHVLVLDPYWRSTINYCLQIESYIGCDLPQVLVENVHDEEE